MCVCTCMCVRVCDYIFYVQQVKKALMAPVYSMNQDQTVHLRILICVCVCVWLWCERESVCVCVRACACVCVIIFSMYNRYKRPLWHRIQHEPRSDCASTNSDLCVRVCVVVV